MTAKKPDGRWLMLVHQLPSKPAYRRVKVWRRLQALFWDYLKNRKDKDPLPPLESFRTRP